MRIALTGPGGSGKSTLLEALSKKDELKHLEFLPEVTRTIKNMGFKINEACTADTQVLVLSSHTDNLLYKDNFIVDRCLIDGYIYTHLLSSIDPQNVPIELVEYSWFLLKRYGGRYDHIFYIPLEFEVKDDGVRSISKAFSEEIPRRFEMMIPILQQKYKLNISTLTGTVEERVTQFLKEIAK